jgi:RNA polymerase sigma factor (sigma-70 family)
MSGLIAPVQVGMAIGRESDRPRSTRGPADRRGGMASCSPTDERPVTALQSVLLGERARLLRFLAARGAADEAEDLLHELWQRVATAPRQPIGDPLSYLFRAAENLMRDKRRSTLSRERRQFEWHEVAATPEELPTGERSLIARERLREVQASLAALGPRVELVFRRCRLDGVSQVVAARDLGVSLSSVEKDLQKAYRALAQLKAKFDAE